MKPLWRKPRPKDTFAYPSLLPDRPRTIGRSKSLDRAVQNDFSITLLRRMLQRHDDLEALCFAIGWITHNWALVEQNFEMCIAIIYHDLDGKTLVSSKLPLPWNQKVEYLQKAFARIARLSSYAAEGAALLDRADELAQQRNDLVHGTLASLRPVEGKWNLKIFDYDRSDKKTNWHVMREFRFGPSDFLSLERKLVPLAGEVATWGHRLWDDIGP